MDLRGKGIECLNLEHGQRIKKFFEENGVDCSSWQFSNNKEDGAVFRYYHVASDNSCFSSSTPDRFELIELPKEELKFPRMMLCWDDDEARAEAFLVFADLTNIKEYKSFYPFRVINSTGTPDRYEHAKEIQPIQKVTRKQIEELVGGKFEMVD